MRPIRITVYLFLILLVVILSLKVPAIIIENTVKVAYVKGVKVQSEITKYQSNNGNLPDQKFLNPEYFGKDVKYVKAGEDRESYYILVQVRFSRDSLVFYSGPLYPKKGWHFRGSEWKSP